MGRKKRIDYIGACHHIIVKGVHNDFIFNDDSAKQKYLQLIVKYREKHDIKVFAYCIMDNHAHLLIQSGKPNKDDEICISAFMHDLQCAFAKWYNKRYVHIGPVFNGRFESFNCHTIPYFITVIDYIHRNPVKHHKLKTYNYRFSSYANFQNGKGLCDLEACYQFLGMSRTNLIAQLKRLKANNNWPFLEQLLERLRRSQKNENIEALLLELAFHIEDLRGSRLIKYFDKVQRELMKELVEIKQMPVKAVSKLFEVSTSYVYQRLKTT